MTASEELVNLLNQAREKVESWESWQRSRDVHASEPESEPDQVTLKTSNDSSSIQKLHV